jgi:hypothetical protein
VIWLPQLAPRVIDSVASRRGSLRIAGADDDRARSPSPLGQRLTPALQEVALGRVLGAGDRPWGSETPIRA